MWDREFCVCKSALRRHGAATCRPTPRRLPQDATSGPGNRHSRPGEETGYPYGPSWARPAAAGQQTAGRGAAESHTLTYNLFEGAKTTLETQLYDANQRTAQREVAYYTVNAAAHQRVSTVSAQLCQARATGKRRREWAERKV